MCLRIFCCLHRARVVSGGDRTLGAILRLSRRYQLGRHWQGSRLSLALILSYLEAGAETAVDIGCNEGVLSCALAWQGLTVTGYELHGPSRETADILARKLGVELEIVGKRLSLVDLEQMKDVDVSLLLSVHHQIAASEGLEHANEFLRALARKTRRQLFFQPAAISRKYRQATPFHDNDLVAISTYFQELLSDIFPHSALIGYSPNDVPRKEPLRPMILFSHSPIELRKGIDVIDTLNEIKRAAIVTHPLVRLFRRDRKDAEVAASDAPEE